MTYRPDMELVDKVVTAADKLEFSRLVQESLRPQAVVRRTRFSRHVFEREMPSVLKVSIGEKGRLNIVCH